MKILVTGSTGFLGGKLVSALLERGHQDIRCFARDRGRCGALLAAAERFPEAQVDLFLGDLLSPEDIAGALDGVEVVFHLASMLRASSSSLFLNNVVASQKLIDAAKQSAGLKRLVLIGSIAVHDTVGLEEGAVIREDTPLDRHPEKRDVYTHSKHMQEQLFWDQQQDLGCELVVIRPSVIYGPGGTVLSPRVGLKLPGIFLHLGGPNRIPITYIDNCVEAIILAGLHPEAAGQSFNIVDDDLPTSKQFLKLYRRQVEPIRFIRIPYPLLMAMARLNQWYHRVSKGQLPAIFTPHKSASMYKYVYYDNSKLKRLGWTPRVSTEEAMNRSFESLRPV